MRYASRWLSGRGRAALGLLALALALACVPKPTMKPEPPEHLRPIVEGWADVARRNIAAVFDEQHTGTKWLEFDAARAAARQAIADAGVEDRPWLLGRYLDVFFMIGLGTPWVDAVLEIPPDHPVWSTDSDGLAKALREASDPVQFRAYLDAVAAAHDNPNVQASVLALELADADRARDWPRAEALDARLQSLELAETFAAREARALSPSRGLRADMPVPKFCAPAIAGPDQGIEVCIDSLVPHDRRTLLIGWATWCGPCKQQLPKVVELVDGRPLRVIAITYADEREHAVEHLRELGVEDWTILDLGAEQMKRDAIEGSLEWEPIPYLVLVDEQGIIEAGPPWLDVAALADAL